MTSAACLPLVIGIWPLVILADCWALLPFRQSSSRLKRARLENPKDRIDLLKQFRDQLNEELSAVARGVIV